MTDPVGQWKLVEQTGRSYYKRADGVYLVVWHEADASGFCFVGYNRGVEVGSGEGYSSRLAAQEAAEAV